MSSETAKAALRVTVPVLAALISFFLLFGAVSSPEYVGQWTKEIDESRDTVLKLTASAAAASAAITVLPGDVATPIADELAELTKCFLVVLCALYLEKFIVAISGVVACKWLVPIACGAYLLGAFSRREGFRAFGRRVLIFSLAFILVVPASLRISKLVETSYEASINQVIESAENSANQIQESVGVNRDQEDAGNGLAKIIRNLQNSGDTIANGTSQLIEYFEKLLSRFVESVAIMLVISCIIPILVMLLFFWIIKSLFNVDTYTSYRRMESLLRKKREHNEHFEKDPA